ncbi:MAG: AIPR family protein [Planctomycetaceae bacterium]|nr:AIPR family protein [Planctomycetaceae bacterium]
MASKTQPTSNGSTITENEVMEHLKTRPVAIRRIARFLFTTFHGSLDLQDLGEQKLEKRIEAMLSRAVAAQAVHALTGMHPRDAAACVVDGGQDLGIDAIAFDDVQKRCWLFQSKFCQSGKGEISWTDVSKFLDGFEALTSEDFDHANPKILKRERDIRRAATEVGWKFTLVSASTSSNPHTERSVQEIQERLAYQDPGNAGVFTFDNFDLVRLTQSVERSYEPKKLKITVALDNWGCVTDPFTGYYGQVSVGDIFGWKEHGLDLFAKNLRAFVGSSQVVDSISDTLRSKSELFWYFNNGATILCEKIERSGPYKSSTSRDRGFFECSGASVVNGAQTIGTIWEQPGRGADLDPRAKVHLRLISLEGTPADFANLVTRATNTQKNILPRDFATLDEAQRRLAREFQMDSRMYVFRQGDMPPPPDKGTHLEEAALAVACSMSVEFAVIAYRNAGFLIDVDNPYYQAIFNTPDKPRADELWLLVKILRASERALAKLKENAPSSRHKHVATHGMRYVQYRVMNDSLVKQLRGRHSLSDGELEQVVSQATELHFEKIAAYIAAQHDRDYLQTLFKNTAKVKAIDDALNADRPVGSSRRVQKGLFSTTQTAD